MSLTSLKRYSKAQEEAPMLGWFGHHIITPVIGTLFVVLIGIVVLASMCLPVAEERDY